MELCCSVNPYRKCYRCEVWLCTQHVYIGGWYFCKQCKPWYVSTTAEQWMNALDMKMTESSGPR